ncbi:MAG TPA: hypothetical protein VGI22_13105 [Xanthobacteraceae bacterium]|jgi:hypothetical protein
MRVPAFALVVLLAPVGVGGCVPDVVTIEAVPTPKFARALAQCQAEAANEGFSLGDPVKHCLKAKGYHFLKQY